VELADGEGSVSWTSRLKGWQALISRLNSELTQVARDAGRLQGVEALEGRREG
jgi:hypothetical protein